MYSANPNADPEGIPNPPRGEAEVLLPPVRYPSIPTSANHIAEQMESGGAKIEETLSRLNCKYQTLFFCAGLAVLLAGIVGLIGSLFTFELANLVDSFFLVIFGLIMMILDVPGSPRWAGRYRSLCRKYVRFLTRLTGKALWFLFLGCMTACNLWPTEKARGGLLFFAVFISFFIILVSVMGLLIAVRKSVRLEKIRKAVIMGSKGIVVDAYRKYAMTDPLHGMQFEEFNRMCADHTSGKLQFDITDLGIIYNALDEHQKSAINEREFCEWASGSMTYI